MSKTTIEDARKATQKLVNTLARREMENKIALAVLPAWIHTLGARRKEPSYTDSGAAFEAVRLSYETAKIMADKQITDFTPDDNVVIDRKLPTP